MISTLDNYNPIVTPSINETLYEPPFIYINHLITKQLLQHKT